MYSKQSRLIQLTAAILVFVGSGCDGTGIDSATHKSALLPGNYQRLFIPAYYYPDQQQILLWFAQANEANDVTVVVNFDSGPGPAPDPSCNPNCDNQTWVKNLQANDVTILGYVDNYYNAAQGNRSGQAIVSDIDHWISWYGVDGIMFDDSQRDPAYATDDDVARTEYLETYVQNHLYSQHADWHYMVAFNWGQTAQLQRYAFCSVNYYNGWQNTIFSTFEGPESTYTTQSFPTWLSHYDSGGFYHLVYGSSGVNAVSPDMQRARQFNASRVFVTDDMGSTWQHVPGWNDFPNEYDIYTTENSITWGTFSDTGTGAFSDNGNPNDPNNSYMTFYCPPASLCPGGGTNC